MSTAEEDFNNPYLDFNKFPCIPYMHIKNRQGLARGLLTFGMTNFSNCFVVKNIGTIQDVIMKNRKLKYEEALPFVMNKLVDSIRIISCFENYMKAHLLINDFVIHSIIVDKNHKDVNRYRALKKQQDIRPVKFSELLALSLWIKSDIHLMESTLPGISKYTLSFSKLLSDRYQEEIKLPKEVLRILVDINENRNDVHLYYGGRVDLDGKTYGDLKQLSYFIDNTMKPMYKFLEDELNLPEN
jgi:hypothetical protein